MSTCFALIKNFFIYNGSIPNVEISFLLYNLKYQSNSKVSKLNLFDLFVGNSTKKVKIAVVYGPTASGKTDLAVDIAKQCNGELINADSRQVYKYMDIGTNKEKNLDVPIHLIDLVTPNIQFSVHEYVELAIEKIAELVSRGKFPIIVGGTGLYINALINKYSLPKIEVNTKLREELNALSTEELQIRLNDKNKEKFESMNNSDRQNPRRLIRALEIAESSNTSNLIEIDKGIEFNVEWYKTDYDLDSLFAKIDKRVDKMIDDGLIDEVKNLVAMGYSFDLPIMKTMGYREVSEYLNGKLDLSEMTEKIKLSHRQYVKKQITWNKKYLGQ